MAAAARLCKAIGSRRLLTGQAAWVTIGKRASAWRDIDMSRHSRGPVAAATLVAVGVVLTLTIGVLRLAGPPAGAQQTEDPALLRELAERLLSPLVAGAPQPRIYPGALPPDAPRDLIVPPGVRLLGSAELPRFGPPEQPATITITVIFDTSTTPDDIFAYYRDQLAVTGWTPAPALRVKRRCACPMMPAWPTVASPLSARRRRLSLRTLCRRYVRHRAFR